jgi:hypothetical protein
VAITNNELTTKSGVPGHIVTTNNSHEMPNSGAILTSDRRADQVRARTGPAEPKTLGWSLGFKDREILSNVEAGQRRVSAEELLLFI